MSLIYFNFTIKSKSDFSLVFEDGYTSRRMNILHFCYFQGQNLCFVLQEKKRYVSYHITMHSADTFHFLSLPRIYKNEKEKNRM